MEENFYLKPIELKLQSPIRLILNQGDILIDEIIDTLIIKPPLARHLFPRVSDIGKGFSKLAFLEQNFYCEKVKKIISDIQPINSFIKEIKEDINESFKNYEQGLNSFDPIFEQEILDSIFAGELLEAKTKQGNIIIKKEIFDSDSYSLSLFDYQILMLLIKETFFFLPYNLAREEVRKITAKILEK